jgi:hypothetical protein
MTCVDGESCRCDLCDGQHDVFWLGDLMLCAVCAEEHDECANHCGTVVRADGQHSICIAGDYYCDECVTRDEHGRLAVVVLE